jgi:citrate synthase
MAGWLAQWEEMLLDKEQKIARPRQIYVGPAERAYETKLSDFQPDMRKDSIRK